MKLLYWNKRGKDYHFAPSRPIDLFKIDCVTTGYYRNLTKVFLYIRNERNILFGSSNRRTNDFFYCLMMFSSVKRALFINCNQLRHCANTKETCIFLQITGHWKNLTKECTNVKSMLLPCCDSQFTSM